MVFSGSIFEVYLNEAVFSSLAMKLISFLISPLITQFSLPSTCNDQDYRRIVYKR